MGFVFGLSQSIKSLGALLALWIGPLVINKFGIQNGLFIIACISSIGIFLSLSIAKISYLPVKRIRTKKTFSLTPLNILISVLAITIDGILVVVLASLFSPSTSSSAKLLITVAFYLLLKRLSMAGISILSGILSLHVSPIKLFNISILICIIGLVFIVMDFIQTGIILSFFANSIVVTFSPIVAIKQQKKEVNSLQAISSISTWWDLGAGVGSFTGILLIGTFGKQYLFLSLAILISLLYIIFNLQNGKTNRATL